MLKRLLPEPLSAAKDTNALLPDSPDRDETAKLSKRRLSNRRRVRCSKYHARGATRTGVDFSSPDCGSKGCSSTS